MEGITNTKSFLELSDCRVIAACDVDKKHLNNLSQIVNRKYQNKDCKGYHDYRELMARTDIDAVMLAVPDHWHELVAVEAARRKKDIYGEKPLARTIKEQQVMVKAVADAGRIWQTGSWQRSVANFHKAAEIVRNGLIGTVKRIEVGLPKDYNNAETRQASLHDGDGTAVRIGLQFLDRSLANDALHSRASSSGLALEL